MYNKQYPTPFFHTFFSRIFLMQRSNANALLYHACVFSRRSLTFLLLLSSFSFSWSWLIMA